MANRDGQSRGVRVAVITTAVLLVVSMAPVGCVGLTWLQHRGWELKALPAGLDVDRVVVSDEPTGWGIHYDCEFATYELSDQMARRVSTEGLAPLATLSKPRGYDHVAAVEDGQNYVYLPWRPTPLPQGEWVKRRGITYPENYPALPRGGCSKRIPASVTMAVDRALSTQGSYFTVTDNRLALILVSPRTRLVAFLQGSG